MDAPAGVLVFYSVQGLRAKVATHCGKSLRFDTYDNGAIIIRGFLSCGLKDKPQQSACQKPSRTEDRHNKHYVSLPQDCAPLVLFIPSKGLRPVHPQGAPNKDWIIFLAIRKEKAVTLSPPLPYVYDSYLFCCACPCWVLTEINRHINISRSPIPRMSPRTLKY